MRTLVKKELRLSRKFLLIWIGMDFLLCICAYIEYLSLKDTMDELVELIDAFPRLLKIMFGCPGDLTTTIGWFGCIYFWVAILNFSYAMYLGVTCVLKEKKQGSAEYIFTRPVGRETIVDSKVVASLVNLFILAAVSGVINYLTGALPLGGLENRTALFTTTLGMFFTEAVLFAMGLVIAALAPSYHWAVKIGAAVLLIFYGIFIAADYFMIKGLCFLTPLKYFDVYEVAEDGLSPLFLLLSLGIVALCVKGAERCWSRREIII